MSDSTSGVPRHVRAAAAAVPAQYERCPRPDPRLVGTALHEIDVAVAVDVGRGEAGPDAGSVQGFRGFGADSADSTGTPLAPSAVSPSLPPKRIWIWDSSKASRSALDPGVPIARSAKPSRLKSAATSSNPNPPCVPGELVQRRSAGIHCLRLLRSYSTERPFFPGALTARSALPLRSKSPLATAVPKRSVFPSGSGTSASLAREDGDLAARRADDHHSRTHVAARLRGVREAEHDVLAVVTVEVVRRHRRL